jgi:hypothetical protein
MDSQLDSNKHIEDKAEITAVLLSPLSLFAGLPLVLSILDLGLLGSFFVTISRLLLIVICPLLLLNSAISIGICREERRTWMITIFSVSLVLFAMSLRFTA